MTRLVKRKSLRESAGNGRGADTSLFRRITAGGVEAVDEESLARLGEDSSLKSLSLKRERGVELGGVIDQKLK